MGRYVHVWTTGGWTFWPARMHTQFLKPRTAWMPWLAQSCSRCSTWFWVITRFQSRKKTSPKQQAGSVRVHHHVVWVDKCAVYIPAGDGNSLQRSSVVKMPHLPGGCSDIWQDARKTCHLVKTGARAHPQCWLKTKAVKMQTVPNCSQIPRACRVSRGSANRSNKLQ